MLAYTVSRALGGFQGAPPSVQPTVVKNATNEYRYGWWAWNGTAFTSYGSSDNLDHAQSAYAGLANDILNCVGQLFSNNAPTKTPPPRADAPSEAPRPPVFKQFTNPCVGVGGIQPAKTTSSSSQPTGMSKNAKVGLAVGGGVLLLGIVAAVAFGGKKG